MKKQVVIIHGGDTFETYEEYMSFLKGFEIENLDYLSNKNWKSSLPEELGDNFEIIAPRMPNSMNAKYSEWKIWFEKFFPFLNDNVVLVGHSLGGIFLAKYLSENDFPKKIASIHLVAAPYDDKDCDEALADFALSGKVDNLTRYIDKIFLYHSKDDASVPFVDLEKYKTDLPEATFRVFEDRGHFRQEKLPELVEDIKK